jgi:hypothetical protein
MLIEFMLKGNAMLHPCEGLMCSLNPPPRATFDWLNPFAGGGRGRRTFSGMSIPTDKNRSRKCPPSPSRYPAVSSGAL